MTCSRSQHLQQKPTVSLMLTTGIPDVCSINIISLRVRTFNHPLYDKAYKVQWKYNDCQDERLKKKNGSKGFCHKLIIQSKMNPYHRL